MFDRLRIYFKSCKIHVADDLLEIPMKGLGYMSDDGKGVIYLRLADGCPSYITIRTKF